jgi:hypothetical protein
MRKGYLSLVWAFSPFRRQFPGGRAIFLVRVVQMKECHHANEERSGSGKRRATEHV